MKNPPVYENLDTSFINLAALVRFLHSRRFVGSLRVELEGYEADMEFDGENFVTREHDRIAGRIAEGDEAFARLLIRARAPGGTINVFETATRSETSEEYQPTIEEQRKPLPMPAESFEKAVTPNVREVTPKPTFAAPLTAEDFHHSESFRIESKAIVEEKLPPDLNLPANEEILSAVSKTLNPQDFEFTNHVEELARQKQTSPEEWEQLLNLITELLGIIDRDLARANLNFSAAFARAGTEISADYPFLNPASGAFVYANGHLTVNEIISAKIFVAGINEALRRIVDKLAANPKFAQVYQQTAQSIHALAVVRKSLYDKFFITPQLERIVSVKNTLAA